MTIVWFRKLNIARLVTFGCTANKCLRNHLMTASRSASDTRPKDWYLTALSSMRPSIPAGFQPLDSQCEVGHMEENRG